MSFRRRFDNAHGRVWVREIERKQVSGGNDLHPRSLKQNGMCCERGGRIMDESEYLRSIARRCADLAAHCFHLEIAGQLRELADELTSKAVQKNFADRDEGCGHGPKKN